MLLHRVYVQFSQHNVQKSEYSHHSDTYYVTRNYGKDK